jgi:hypothetical protein
MTCKLFYQVVGKNRKNHSQDNHNNVYNGLIFIGK